MSRLYLTLAQVVDVGPLPHTNANDARITTALSVTFAITGAIALLIVTLAGFKYITSQGNPQEVAKARNAIIYALIGLAVSILAMAVVQFTIRTVG